MKFHAATFALLTVSCAMDGGGVISGRELNERIRQAVVLKATACYPGDSGAVFLYSEVNPRYDRGQFYQTKDVDACLESFNAIPCSFFHSTFGRQAISLYFANVYAFVCPGLSDKEFLSPRYLEGNFPEASSSSQNTSSSSSN